MNNKKLMNECPTIIGMITATLESGGSIDTAIRTIAEEGPKNSRGLFIDTVRMTDTKGFASLSSGLIQKMSELPNDIAGYRRSIMMAISASESSSIDERDQMLRDSADIALEAVREMGESYGSSLTTPCMTVFGLGIMVPMILMSVLPMLNIGGMFGAKTISQSFVVLITLILIPAAILAVSITVRNRNPFLTGSFSYSDLHHMVPMLLSLPLAAVYWFITHDTDLIFLFSIAPACVLSIILMTEGIRAESKKHRCEQGLMDSVFDVGNRMLSGTNFEIATVESTSGRSECNELSQTLSREYSLCRGNVLEAINRTVLPISYEMSIALRNIRLCSDKDNEDAGKLAVTLGKQFQNRNITRKNLESKLKSMTDMMTGTAMLFAPMVLGLSVAMLKPLSKISSDISMAGTSIILETYLVELCAIISILMSSIGDGCDSVKTMWRFCLMCPISLVVFTICSMISL